MDGKYPFYPISACRIVFICKIYKSSSESLQVLSLFLFSYWRFVYQSRRVEVSLTGLSPPYFCTCPKLGARYPLTFIICISVFQKYEVCHIMFRVWVLLIVEEPTVTMKCRTAIKVMFLYLILCPSVMLDSLSCSFTSTAILTNSHSHCQRFFFCQLLNTV